MNNKILQESADDSILQEDLDRISESDIPLEELKGKTVLVTGATGLIGSLLVKALQCCNRRKETGIKILALVRNQEKAERLFGDLLKREDLKLVIGDITMPVEVDDKIDHIIHCASITTSKVMISRPVDVIRTSLNGTENLLELAKEKQVRSMVYVSSMEMYGALNLQNDQMVTEEMTGYLNPLALRSNYPESKRMCENMCVAYGTQYEVPVKIARLAQTFGAGVLPGENRVFAQFARSAMKGSDIVLHTEGKSEGNYCYTADAVRALLTILVKGENMQAYNVVNQHDGLRRTGDQPDQPFGSEVHQQHSGDHHRHGVQIHLPHTLAHPRPVRPQAAGRRNARHHHQRHALQVGCQPGCDLLSELERLRNLHRRAASAEPRYGIRGAAPAAG